jgi:hypothetical protein
MVLIVTMLVALGLSLIGAIIIESTRADTATAGHVRASEQMSYVSEIGTMVGMRVFSLNYSLYRRYMTFNRRLSHTFTRLSFDTGAPGAAPTLVLGSSLIPGSLGYTDLSPEYAVLVDRAYEYGDAEGYSVSGTQGVSFCFRRYTFTTSGEMDVVVPGLPGSPRMDSRSTLRATSVIGPTDCTL